VCCLMVDGICAGADSSAAQQGKTAPKLK